jgi:hypothetical protein
MVYEVLLEKAVGSGVKFSRKRLGLPEFSCFNNKMTWEVKGQRSVFRKFLTVVVNGIDICMKNTCADAIHLWYNYLIGSI